VADEGSRNGPQNAEEESSEGGASIAIGLYIAVVILVFGTVLVLYGLTGSPDNEKSLGININLWWGLLMVVSGILALGLSVVSRRRGGN
jgi:H+/Cl- antiporter ClcA